MLKIFLTATRAMQVSDTFVDKIEAVNQNFYGTSYWVNYILNGAADAAA